MTHNVQHFSGSLFKELITICKCSFYNKDIRYYVLCQLCCILCAVGAILTIVLFPPAWQTYVVAGIFLVVCVQLLLCIRVMFASRLGPLFEDANCTLYMDEHTLVYSAYKKHTAIQRKVDWNTVSNIFVDKLTGCLVVCGGVSVFKGHSTLPFDEINSEQLLGESIEVPLKLHNTSEILAICTLITGMNVTTSRAKFDMVDKISILVGEGTADI